MIRSLLVVCVWLAVSGCAHEVVARKPIAEFKYQPSGGNSLIVLYRNVAGFLGGGAMVNAALTIDQKALGDLTQDRFVVITVAPGEHTVNLVGASGVSNMLVTTAAGDVRFIQVTTYPTLSSSQRERPEALLDLDNEGDPLRLGYKYSFTDPPAPAAVDPSTSRL